MPMRTVGGGGAAASADYDCLSLPGLQRRTGAPFGVLHYYRGNEVSIQGDAKPFKRVSAEGNDVETFFCPHCGSTVFLKLAKQPGLIGVALGAMADPASEAPMW